MVDLAVLRNQMKKRKEMNPSFSSQRVPSIPHNNYSQDAECLYHIAECNDDGLEGHEINEEKAMAEYLVAAELGHSKAMSENRAENEGREETNKHLQEKSKGDDSYCPDRSRSDKIYETFTIPTNLENTINLLPNTLFGFPNRIGGIQKLIDKGDLSDYEADRLLLLMGWLSLIYFKEHFCDDDFEDNENEYFEILDKVDDYINSMSTISNEAMYLYNIANMYSANRFKDIDPLEKLEELWNNLQSIKLDEDITEFKVSFWEETAKDIYDLMSALLASSVSDDSIKDKVISIIADKLELDKDCVHTYSRLKSDLGVDSLDAVELIMEMEAEFEITIPDEDAEKIRTVGDIITYIKIH